MYIQFVLIILDLIKKTKHNTKFSIEYTKIQNSSNMFLFLKNEFIYILY